MSAPGWYPDPSGGPTRRYFDGMKWTDQVLPIEVPAAPPSSKALRRFVFLLVASLVTAIVAFVAMQLAFGAAANDSLFPNIIGFALFGLWLASIGGFLVGLIGAIVHVVRK